MAELARAYTADPYSYAEARALAAELGLSQPLAITLVRRGYRSPAEARTFLEARESHDPGEFASMGEATERLLAAARDGRRITVHGDFDVDGVCATAIAVSALRSLGADCDWLIPDRLADGYGLSVANVERLAARGTTTLLTVDCGITAVSEVARARELGIDVVVTDHHQPQEGLPDCLLIHPALDGYPFAELCGTAVAWKLACSLREAAGHPRAAAERDLDLVALATVADLVPLVGENRSLVRRGLAAARRGERPGMRALIAASGCDPARLDEGDMAFRLAPRINAAGRLYRADAGVELMLTGDEGRASEIALELDRANRERRDAEREVEAAAESARRELPAHLREPALVLAGAGWHPGVIGIVASRLVERYWMPVVLISLAADGSGRGSGRSIPGFDLLGGLEACSEHLRRFGGHRAAAGLELDAGALERFREAFVDHSRGVLGPEQLRKVERIDAMVGGAGIGLELAEELEQLGPFGAGNPGVRLMVPSARVRAVQTIGDGKHARFSLHSGSHRALGVAFGRPALGVTEDELVDAAVRLEVNQWNGSLEPRLVLRDLYAVERGSDEAQREPAHACRCEPPEWWQRFDDELSGALDRPPADRADAEALPARSGREVVPHGGGSPTTILAELVSSGEGVLAVCADASRRSALASGAVGLSRFAGGRGFVACGRCSRAEIDAAAARAAGGLLLADYAALELVPHLAGYFQHVVLVDPPPTQRLAEDAASPAPQRGFLHPAWGPVEQEFAASVLEEQWGLLRPLRSLFAALRADPPLQGEELRAALRGDGRHPRSPELAGRCLRVLLELGLVQGGPEGPARAFGVVSSVKTDLERSPAFQAYRARFEGGKKFLARATQP